MRALATASRAASPRVATRPRSPRSPRSLRSLTTGPGPAHRFTVKFPPHADDPLPPLATLLGLLACANAAGAMREVGRDEDQVRQSVRAARPGLGSNASVARSLHALAEFAQRSAGRDGVVELPSPCSGQPDLTPAIVRAGGLDAIRATLRHSSVAVADAAMRALDALAFKRAVARVAVQDRALVDAYVGALERLFAFSDSSSGSDSDSDTSPWCDDCGSPLPVTFHALSAAERLLAARGAEKLPADVQHRLGLALREAGARLAAAAAARARRGLGTAPGHDLRGF